MTTTARFGLPLLQAAQAQKHVTVNEALALIDGACQMVLGRCDQVAPPLVPAEGDAYGVGTGATDGWAGQDGKIALFVNGGWVFLIPGAGWRAWDLTLGTMAVHDGAAWVPGGVAVSPNGAATVAEVIEADVTLAAGPEVITPALIPTGSVVEAVTARVIQPVSGVPSWRLGVAGGPDRYGTGYGVGGGSWARGVTGQPQAYYGDTALVIGAEGGTFTGGQIRIAVHLTRFTLPRM
ncbi:MAG: DUF2793 domain-containing protein [Qingshengfaniella sp.]